MKNPNMQKLIQELKKTAQEQKIPLWKRVAEDLAKPTRQRRVVNLSSIEKHANEQEIIIVPGKVLGDGELKKKVTIAAYTFSQSALEKIKKAGAKAYRLEVFLKEQPKPKKAKLLG